MKVSLKNKMTFSIIGIDKKNNEMGIACFSKAFAIGGVVPSIDLDVGVVATQSYPNVSYKSEALKLMKSKSPKKVISILTKKDKDSEIMQVILMNSKGEYAGFTGSKNVEWAGHLIGKNCICAGNMLTGENVLTNMVAVFEKSKKSLGERLLESLKAGEKAGGDKRNKNFGSACLIIEKRKKGIFGIGNRFIDIRVDYSADAIKDLIKLFRLSLKER